MSCSWCNTTQPRRALLLTCEPFTLAFHWTLSCWPTAEPRVTTFVTSHLCSYESATEGDSFILAFHGPLDAARFALLAQAALMELPWPTELLGHEDGKEVRAYGIGV